MSSKYTTIACPSCHNIVPVNKTALMDGNRYCRAVLTGKGTFRVCTPSRTHEVSNPNMIYIYKCFVRRTGDTLFIFMCYGVIDSSHVSERITSETAFLRLLFRWSTVTDDNTLPTYYYEPHYDR